MIARLPDLEDEVNEPAQNAHMCKVFSQAGRAKKGPPEGSSLVFLTPCSEHFQISLCELNLLKKASSAPDPGSKGSRRHKYIRGQTSPTVALGLWPLVE